MDGTDASCTCDGKGPEDECFSDNSAQPLISVACLAYNQEDYIRETLEGFLAQQTSFSFEVVVHDDASSDATPAIIAEYVQKYPAIFRAIIQRENQYSKGIDIFQRHILPECRGKYIAWCEGDDYWCDPQKLERQAAYLEAHPDCPACAHNTWLFDCRNGERRIMSKMDVSDMIPIELLLSAGDSYHTSSLVSRKSIYESAPDYSKETHGVGDYPERVYLALNGGVFFLNTPMSVYRYRAKGSWSESNHKNRQKAIETHRALIDMLCKADELSGGKYHRYFTDAINEQVFMNLDLAGDYKSMLKRDYRKHFMNCSAKKKCRLLVSAACPPLGRALDR